MIYTLNGFAGKLNMFDFIKAKKTAIDLYNLSAFTIDELDQIIPYNEEKNILIGYSMGARLAAQMFIKNPKKYKHCYFLAGHMGLRTNNDRLERKKIEDVVKDKLECLNHEEFEVYWNNLSLFENDQAVKINYQKEILLSFIQNFCLSKQPYLIDDLLKYKEQITFIYGLNDPKYTQYAKLELHDFNVNFFKDAGHRVYQNQKVQDYLNKELL